MSVSEPQHSSPAEARARELRSLLDHGIEHAIGVGHSLGISVESLEGGRAVYTMTPSTSHANALLTVHGGVLTTLLDTAMGSAVFLRLPDHTTYTTLELKVNFIRPVGLDGGTLTCEAQAVHVGKRTATVEGRITDPTGRLIAHGSCTCLILPA